MSKALAITPGEPAGVGPELAVRLAAQWDGTYPLVLIGDRDLLQQKARQQQLSLRWADYPGTGPLQVIHMPCEVPVTSGELDSRNASYVVATLRRAAQGCLDGSFAALCTGPVHKGIINQADISFSGHTEFFAAEAGVPRVVMMLAVEELRVALATTHLPLRQVADAIDTAMLGETIEILHRDLQHRFGIAKPRIAVCGLNPHAGEGGYLGSEETEVISPALVKAATRGIDLAGPFPADTLLTPAKLAGYDAVLAMYHDQGLPVLKYAGFGRAVNITLGLPFVRTSVDHGTALDIAGKGIADLGSFRAAAKLAAELV